MKNYIIVILALISTVTLISCEKTIKLDLRKTESKVVIEGLVTNLDGYQYIKVTRSADFYSTDKPPAVTDATVTVTDDQNGVYNFVYNPQHKDGYEGVYLPETPFKGEIGRTYS